MTFVHGHARNRLEKHPITDRATWLQWRKRDLTASDLGAVAGVNPHRSALQVYAEKTGAIEPQPDTQLMRRGRWMEPAVLAAVRETMPTWTVRRAGVYLRDPDCRLGGTPDAVAEDSAAPGELINVQCKLVARPVFEASWTDDSAPPEYMIQTAAENYLTNATRGVIAAMVVDTYSADLVLIDVPRHYLAEQQCRDLAADFWRRVELRQPPDYDYGKDTALVNAIEARLGTEIDLSRDNRIGELLQKREELGLAVDQSCAELVALENEIKAKIGSAESAIVPGWRLSWKEQTRKAGFVSASTFRVLRVKRTKI